MRTLDTDWHGARQLQWSQALIDGKSVHNSNLENPGTVASNQ